jgi:hypothetical protein
MSDGVPQFTTAEYSGNTGNASGEQILKDSHTAFGRGVLFGIGGAILGLGIYVGFALATGWMIGYISLAVGYIVGKAIVMGSGGVGGRRYQVAAVLLTYIAVSLAAIPIAVSQQHAQVSDSPAVGSPKMSFGSAVGTLTLIGLASPFLALSNPAQGIIGLIILFVGIQIAWKITAARPITILGPISETVPAAPG